MAAETKKTRRRWVRRILVHAGIVLCLLAALLAAVLIFPFESRLLDRQIAKAFHRATHLRIAFDSAVYRLARGHATLSGIRVDVPGGGQPVTRIDQMDFEWKWRLWGSWPPLELHAIDVAAPAPVVFYLEKGGKITPSPALKSSLDLLHTFEQRPGGSRELARPVKITIRKHAVYLEEKPDAAEESPTAAPAMPPAAPVAPPAVKRLAGLEALDVEMEYSGVGIWPLLVSGRLWGKHPASVAGSLGAGAGGKGYAFYAETSFLDSEDHFRKPLPFSVAGRAIRVSGHIGAGESAGTSNFDLSVKGKDLRTSCSQSRLELPATDLALQTSGVFNSTSRTLQLKNAELRAFESALFGGGRFSFEGRKSFTVEITTSSLSSQVLNRLQALAPPEAPRAAVLRGGVQLRGRVSGSWARDQRRLDNFDLSVEGKDLQTSFSQTGLDLLRTDLEFRTLVAFDSTSRTLRFQNTELRAFQSALAGNGSVSLEETRPFALEITGCSLAPEALNPLLSLAPKEVPRTGIVQGKLQLRGRVSGDRAGVDWAVCQGDVHATDLLLESPLLGEAAPRVGPVAFDARLTTAALELSRLSVQVLANNLTVSSGRVARAAPRANAGPEITANWNLEAVAEEIVRLLPPKAAARVQEWNPRGTVRGFGTIRGEWPVGLFAPDGKPNRESPPRSLLESILSKVRIDGLLQPENVSLDHEKLPAPVKGFSGGIVLGNESVKFSGVKAAIMGSEFSIEGGVSGVPFFWSQPSLDLRLKGGLDLAQAPRWITPDMLQNQTRARIRQMEPTGWMGLDLQLNGPLQEPGKLTLTGTLAPTSVSLSLAMTSPTIAVSDLHGTLELSLPQKVLVPQLDLKMRAVPAPEPVRLALSGSVANTGCNLTLKTSGELPVYKRLVPWVLQMFEVDGPVVLDARFQAALRVGPETAPPPRTPAGLIERLRREYAAEKSPLDGFRRLDGLLDWDFKADIEAKDCEFTHIFMPSRVTHVQGRFLIDREGLRSQGPAKAQWGSSETLTEGAVALTPEGTLRIKFTASGPMLIADEWTKPWGPKRRDMSRWADKKMPAFEPSMKGDFPLNAVIDGTLIGQKASFRQYAFENASAHFEYWDYKEIGGYLEFDRLNAGLYGGAFAMRSQLFVYGPFMKWTVEPALENVICEKLLEAHYGKKPTVNGVLTTKLILQGNAENSLSGKGAFQLQNSRFLGNPVFSALGQLLKSKELEDISFTTMESEFSVRGNELTIPKLSCKGSLMELDAEGKATLDGQLDLIVIYRFLKLVPKLPVLKEIAGVVEDVTSAIVKAHMGGTLKSPEIRIIPFSVDRLNLNLFKSNSNATKKDLPEPPASVPAAP